MCYTLRFSLVHFIDTRKYLQTYESWVTNGSCHCFKTFTTSDSSKLIQHSTNYWEQQYLNNVSEMYNIHFRYSKVLASDHRFSNIRRYFLCRLMIESYGLFLVPNECPFAIMLRAGWSYDIETLSVILALCVGNPSDTVFTGYIFTHWGRDKMAVIFQTTFSNAFSWMKTFEFRLRFDWNLFLRFELTIFQHWFR